MHHALAAAEAEHRIIAEHASATAGRRYVALIAELRNCLAELEAAARLTGNAHGGPVFADLPSYTFAGQPGARVVVTVTPPELERAMRRMLDLATADAPPGKVIALHR